MADTSIIYTAQQGSGIVDVWLDYDAQGKGFLAMVRNPNPANNNIQVVEVRMAQRGQPFPAAPTWPAFTPQHKCDHIKGTHTGATLVLYTDSHLTGGALGDFVELWKKDDVWATTPAYEAERGGAGGYAPAPGGGGGGGGNEEVDYARIQRMVDEAKHWTKDQLANVLRTETVPEVHDQVVASLSGDPGPIADLLYKRIADGTWEQLNKFGNEVGYKPPTKGGTK